jgi:hypothetical protein
MRMQTLKGRIRCEARTWAAAAARADTIRRNRTRSRSRRRDERWEQG